MFDLIQNGIPDELQRLFILNTLFHSFETRSSQIFLISKARTSKFGINTLTYASVTKN